MVLPLVLALLAQLAAATPAAPAAPRSFTLVEAGPGVFAAIADPNVEASLGNAGFVIGPDGVLVVDAFASEGAAGELLAAIRQKTPLPIRFLVETHYHLDHVGGSQVFREAGATILAQENVRAWIRRDWQTDLPAARRETLARLPRPDVTYRDGITVWLGDRRVDILVRPGHTGGDSMVKVPDAKVVFTGDLVSKNAVPGLSDARTGEWLATVEGLLRDDPSATFVPGHGDLARPLDVRFFRDFLSGIRQAVARARKEGKSGAALTEAVREMLARKYARWTWFDHVDQAITAEEQEQAGTKAFPPSPPVP